ncbi:hypothetical protein LDENG_00254800 [Lucifuga dentata]|nr:hypothetical protein LDENG_00254800 [Lucifuga dentata]
MNLYRNFGNLLESWVTEGGQCSDADWLDNDGNSSTSSPVMDAILHSESVDSGVEMESSVMSLPATCCSGSMENTEIETVTEERERNRVTPNSTLQSPLFSGPSSASSSSLNLCPSTTQEPSTALHLKLEQALKRAEPKHSRNNLGSQTDAEYVRQHTRASFFLRRHTAALAKTQRSKSFRPLSVTGPLVSSRQISEPRRCRLSLHSDNRPALEKLEVLGEEDQEGLSPGFRYLEQVCQMLEEIAWQTTRNHALQMEMDALREHQDEPVSQDPDTSQFDCIAAEKDFSASQRLKNANVEHFASEILQRKDYPDRPFRQRSASDTTIATVHTRKFTSDTRGHHKSTDGLFDEAEEDHKKQSSKKEHGNKSSKNWRLKLSSFRKEKTVQSDTKSQQTQFSEKGITRRRLSNLIRRRLKTS